MGVMLRTPDGGVHYASGTFTKNIETVDEQNLTALLIAWQGGDGTIHPVSTEQYADNKFGTPVEWFVAMLQGILGTVNDIKASAAASVAAANAARDAAEAARVAAVAAAAEAKAAHDAVLELDTGTGSGGGPVTIEVFAGIPGQTALKLGDVTV